MWCRDYYPFLKGKRSDSRTLRKLAEYENNRAWQDVFNRNVCIIANLFKWDGLPETVDPMFLEMQLLFFGESCIIYEKDWESYLNLMCTPAGKMNLYYENGFYRAYSLGYSKVFMNLNKFNKNIFDNLLNPFGSDGEEPDYMKGVVCKDNVLSYSLIQTIERYTTRIVNAARAIDVVQNQAKLPSIIETDEDSKLAIQTAINDIDRNVLAVYVGRDTASVLRESKSLQTMFQPAVLDVLWNHYNNLYSEMLTAFGVNNLNTADKKERLITDEVNSNNESIALNIDYRLKYRERFCENLKAVFGINASVSVNSDYKENTPLQSVGEKNGDYNKNAGGDT